MAAPGGIVLGKTLISSNFSDIIFTNESWREKTQKAIENLKFYMRKKLLGVVGVASDLVSEEKDLVDLREAILSTHLYGSLRTQQLNAKNGERPQTTLEMVMWKLDIFDRDADFIQETTPHLEAYILAHLKFALAPTKGLHVT
jgi:hypothetical protein